MVFCVPAHMLFTPPNDHIITNIPKKTYPYFSASFSAAQFENIQKRYQPFFIHKTDIFLPLSIHYIHRLSFKKRLNIVDRNIHDPLTRCFSCP